MDQMYSVFPLVVESYEEVSKHNEVKEYSEEIGEEVLVEVTVLAFAVDSELCSEEMDQMYSVFPLVVESHEEVSKHNKFKEYSKEIVEEALVEVTVLAFALNSELCSDEMDQMYSVFLLIVESYEEVSKYNKFKENSEEIAEEALVEFTVLAFAVDSELCSDEMDQMYSVFSLVVESHGEVWLSFPTCF